MKSNNNGGGGDDDEDSDNDDDDDDDDDDDEGSSPLLLNTPIGKGIKRKRPEGEPGEGSDGNWVVKPKMPVFLWDEDGEGEDEEGKCTVFRGTVIKEAAAPNGDEEVWWAIEFEGGDMFDYPTSRLFQSQEGAQADMDVALHGQY